MKTNNRRDFLKKATIAGASAVAFPQLLNAGEARPGKTTRMGILKKTIH